MAAPIFDTYQDCCQTLAWIPSFECHADSFSYNPGSKVVTLGDSYSSGTGLYQRGNQYDVEFGGSGNFNDTSYGSLGLSECWRETNDKQDLSLRLRWVWSPSTLHVTEPRLETFKIRLICWMQGGRTSTGQALPSYSRSAATMSELLEMMSEFRGCSACFVRKKNHLTFIPFLSSF